MTRTTVRGATLAMAMSVLLGIPDPAAAQPQAPPAPTVLPVSRNLPVVWVITADGQERKGRLLSFTPDRLIVHVGKASQTINTAEVVRVDTTDALSNGIRNGVISGLVVGGLGFAALVGTCEDCGGGEVVAAGLLAMGVYTAIGAGLGALIDHAIEGRLPIYQRSAPSRLSVRPIVGLRQQGVQLRLTW